MAATNDDNEYVCKRCGFTSPYKCVLVKHLERKKVCDGMYEDVLPKVLIDELTKKNEETRFSCTYCNKFLGSRQNKYRHMKICKLKPEEVKLEERKNVLEKQSHILKDLSKQIEDVIRPQVNKFGEEDMSNVSTSFLDECLVSGIDGIVRLLEYVFFTGGIPSNTNIKRVSVKEGLMHVYDGEGWKFIDKQTLIASLIHMSYNKLITHFTEELDKDSTTISNEKENIKTLLAIINKKNCKVYMEVYRKIYVMLLNRCQRSKLV